jgi:hypothetical protein
MIRGADSQLLRRPIFIVGVGRSGTSLLHSILASHPDVFFPAETGLLRRFVFAMRIPRQLDKNSLRTAWKVLSNDSRFFRLGVRSLEEMENILGLEDETIKSEEAYIRILQTLARHKTHFGDKDPRLIEYLPLIHSAWPKAFVVHIIRDPRDVLVSKKKASWSRRKPLWHHLLANRVQYRAGHDEGAKLFPNTYIPIYYEELISDADSVVNRLCRSLSIDYQKSMLSFSDEAKRLVAEDEAQWKKETFGRMLEDNYGKWQTELSEFEVTATEFVCGDALSDDTFCLPRHSKTSGTLIVRFIARTYASLIILMSWLYTSLRWLRLRRYSLSG